jgi:CDP-6-deoxy-D-xylo-4-hexulose-3-dehydrase
LNIDVDAVRRAIGPKTKMIVAVSILGNPAPLEELRRLCDEHGLVLFEDNCESLGASIGGVPTGRFGDVATCSFFYAHHISTMEGGVVLTDDPELYELSRALRAHGWTRDLPDGGQLFQRTGDGFSEAYRFLLPGYNVRPLEFSGATGVCQLRKLDKMIAARRENARYFAEAMAGDARYFLQLENGESSWYSFTVIVNPESGMTRHEVLTRLRDMRVDFRMITGGNVMRHEYAGRMGLEAVGILPCANLVHDYGFFVGNAPFPIHDKIDLLVSTLKGIECKS